MAGNKKSHLPSYISAKDRAKQYPSVPHEWGEFILDTLQWGTWPPKEVYNWLPFTGNQTSTCRTHAEEERRKGGKRQKLNHKMKNLKLFRTCLLISSYLSSLKNKMSNLSAWFFSLSSFSSICRFWKWFNDEKISQIFLNQGFWLQKITKIILKSWREWLL